MAVYGRGQMLGSTINPQLMQVDYTPFVNAAAIQGQAMSDIGKTIGKGLEQVGDYFKQQKNAESSAQLGIKIAEAAKVMDPGQAAYYDQLIFSLKDKDTPVSVRGALGANVQDLLDRNIKSRAVSVQEAQMGMRPAYFGGGRTTTARPSYGGGVGGGGAPQSMQMYAGDRGDQAMAQQPNKNLMPPSPDGVEYIPQPGDQDYVALPGEAGADVLNISGLIEKAASLGVPASKINPNISGIESALKNPNEQSEATVQKYKGNLASIVSEAERNFGKPVEDSSGKPIEFIRETEQGEITRYKKDKNNNYFDANGNIVNPETGQPIEKPSYQQIDVEGINRALMEDTGNVLPPLPEASGGETSMIEQKPTRGTPTFADFTNVAPPPGGKLYSVGSETPQNVFNDYEKLTTLSPRKQAMYNSALNFAAQKPETTTSADVEDELKTQLLMSPEKEGAQMMTASEYEGRNNALINKAKKRVGDRSAAYTLLNRYSTIQELMNHPEGYKVFGQTLPQQKLDELARTQGGVYALYNNLKGQDLVQAMRDVKEQSGTAAGMSEKETMALQRAVNELDLVQDWPSAQKTLKRLASGVIRAGTKMGVDESVFEVMPQEGTKRTKAIATDILNNPESVPIFRDEVNYFKKVSDLEKALQPVQSAPTQTQGQPMSPVAPQQNPYDAIRQQLNQQFSLPSR